jgi:hypothetical protein
MGKRAVPADSPWYCNQWEFIPLTSGADFLRLPLQF